MNDIQTLKSKITMSDLLTRLGYQIKNNKAICFIHNDTNPSLSFNEETWYCFGCSIGGDKIKLIEHTHNYDFKEAIAYLSNITGYELPVYGKANKIDHVQNIADIITRVNNTDWVLMYMQDEIKQLNSLLEKWTIAAYKNLDNIIFETIENKCEKINESLIILKKTRKKHCQQKTI